MNVTDLTAGAVIVADVGRFQVTDIDPPIIGSTGPAALWAVTALADEAPEGNPISVAFAVGAVRATSQTSWRRWWVFHFAADAKVPVL